MSFTEHVKPPCAIAENRHVFSVRHALRPAASPPAFIGRIADATPPAPTGRGACFGTDPVPEAKEGRARREPRRAPVREMSVCREKMSVD
jgi:hypothetical protein